MARLGFPSVMAWLAWLLVVWAADGAVVKGVFESCSG